VNNANDLEVIVRSRFPLVVVETREETRAIDLLQKIANRNEWPIFTWSATDGLERRNWRAERVPESRDPEQMLRHIEGSPQNGVFVLLDFHPFLDNPVHVRLIKDIAQGYARTPRTLVFVSQQITLPDDLQRLSARFDIAIPNADAIRAMLQEEAHRWHSGNGEKVKAQREAIDALVQHLVGLCEEDARRLIVQAIQNDGAVTMEDLPAVLRAKHDLLGASDLLQFELDTTKFSDIGGLKNLKRWLEQRKDAFTGDAQVAGLEPPKGILILGVQGGGKSLAAKAVAGVWGLPLLRLDIGALYDKFIGETERKLREMLKSAEAMAPCVMWMDEIEKGLATEANDEGVSRRMLGTLLTWMAERKSKVFLVATANDISALPPELVRKGRLDELFFVDLPDAETRRDILTIHLRKRKLDPVKFDLDQLVKVTEGFSGAEIEQAIVAAQYESHASKQPLGTAHIVAEAQRTRPLSVVMAEKIAALRAWATGRTVMAN
jgi:SpoVK/Ycf46/Vps4 family AAA+-type ATPase